MKITEKTLILPIALLLIALFVSGCAYQYKIIPFNAQIIKKSVDDAVTKTLTEVGIPERTLLSIVSIENPETSDDDPLNSLIIDSLISGFTSNKTLVVVRDDDIMARLAIEESGNRVKYLLSKKLREGDLTKNDIAKLLKELSQLKIKNLTIAPNELNINLTEKRSFLGEEKGKDVNLIDLKLLKDLAPNLKTADKLLTFRVLECGVRYVKDEKPGMVKRQANTLLALRLIDAKSGIIQWADIIEGKSEDRIPAIAIKAAERAHYRFYGFALPNVKETKEDISFAPTEKMVRKKPFKKAESEEFIPQHSIIPFLGILSLESSNTIFGGLKYEYDFLKYIGFEVGAGFGMVENIWRNKIGYIIPTANIIFMYPTIKFEPFLSTGIGAKLFTEKEDLRSLLEFNIGLGCKYRLNKSTALLIDGRVHLAEEMTQELDGEKLIISDGDDYQVTIGLVYYFK